METSKDDFIKRDFMLTTIDNPFNPFTQFQLWYNFDQQQGYNTCSYLSRISKTSSSQTEMEQARSNFQAMQEICDYNPLLYLIIYKDEDFNERMKHAKEQVYE